MCRSGVVWLVIVSGVGCAKTSRDNRAAPSEEKRNVAPVVSPARATVPLAARLRECSATSSGIHGGLGTSVGAQGAARAQPRRHEGHPSRHQEAQACTPEL